MMTVYFECRVQYEKTLEDGIQKKVTESYLLDAVSFTEAEARIVEEVSPFMSGEFAVTDIRRTKFAEIISPEGGADDRWYKAKLVFVTMDEKSGKEKRTPYLCLVRGKGLKGALANLEKGMKGTMGDYDVAAMTETQLLDVFLYSRR